MTRFAPHCLYVFLRAGGRLGVALLAMLPAACTTAQASASHAEPVPVVVAANEKDLGPQLAGLYQRLVVPHRSLADRVATARHLLDSTDPRAPGVLALALKTGQLEEARRAVTEAIAADVHDPPAELKGVLLSHLEDFDSDARADAAAALSRFMDAKLRVKLLTLAADQKAKMEARETALMTLGYDRTQSVAGRLLAFAQPDQPEAIQRAAMAGLATLRGESFATDDYAAWQAWWRQAKAWSRSQWRAHLSADLAAQALRNETERQQLINKLLDTERTLYRQTAKADRPAVVVGMLDDAIEPVRKLGMDLSLQRLLDDQTFPDALTSALRKRLTDNSAEIRRRAMSLLRDLADNPAAEIVADRLARDGIHGPGCLKAALLLLQRLPQTQAVAPAYELMSDPRVRPDAAGVLAAAADANLLPKALAKQAAARARVYLTASTTPDPEMIELLGKVGDDTDFKQIAKWIHSSNAQVKQAAAQAWADAGRPLTELAMHADDPVIQPIVLAAAAQRGKTAEAMLALAAHPPTSTQAMDAWRRALVAMAGRVPGQGVLRVVDVLDQDKSLDSGAIEKVLTAAIDAASKANGGTLDATAGRLMVARGEHRLAAGDAADALADFDATARIDDAPHTLREDAAKGTLAAKLALGQVNGAFALAERLIDQSAATEPATKPAATQPATQPATRPAATQPWNGLSLDASTVANVFEAHAKALGKPGEDQALAELRRLRDMLGHRAPMSVTDRISDLQKSLADRRGPATRPGNARKPDKPAKATKPVVTASNAGASAKRATTQP